MPDKKSGKKSPKKSDKQPVSTAGGRTETGGRVAKKYVSSQIDLAPITAKFFRADIIFDGVDHAGVSYEGRVFLNNETADESTPKNDKNGYAGSFHIFGHGGCFGDVGHCEVRGMPRLYDPRPAHPLTPARKVLIATEAIRQAAKQGKKLTVTVVPIVRAGTSRCDYENVIKLDRISVVTYA